MTDVLAVLAGLFVAVIAGILLANSERLTKLTLYSLIFLCFNIGILIRLGASLESPLKLIQDGLFAALFVSSIASVRTRHWRVTDLFLALFVIFAAFSAFNPLLPSALLGLQGFRLTGATLTAFFVGRSASSLVDLRTTLWMFMPSLVMGLKQAIFGLSSYEIQSLASREATYIVGSSHRLLGGTLTGQDFSYQLGLMLVVAIALTRSKAVRAPTGMILIAVIGALELLALQRSALVGAVVAGLATTWLSLRAGKWRMVLVGVSISSLVALTLVPLGRFDNDRAQVTADRLSFVIRPSDDRNLVERTSQIWPSMIRKISQHPLLGWGAGSAGVLTRRNPTDFPSGRTIADNLYLHIAMQYGIIGLGLFLAFVISALADLWRHDEPIAWAGVGMLTMLLTAGLAGSFISLTGGTIVLFLFLGASITASKKGAPWAV